MDRRFYAVLVMLTILTVAAIATAAIVGIRANRQR
jgi:hypothetical protein